MSATDCWHIMIVEPEEEEGPLVATILHRDDCPVSITHRLIEGKPEIIKTYECGVQYAINEAGYWGLFDRGDVLLPGYWWIRPWVEQIRGLDFTEYDGGWEVVKANNPDHDELQIVKNHVEGGPDHPWIPGAAFDNELREALDLPPETKSGAERDSQARKNQAHWSKL